MTTVISDIEATQNVGANIRRLLAAQKRTTYWLMKSLGVSPGMLYPIVRGESLPTVGTIARIAEVLQVTVDDLLQPTGKNSRKSA